MTARPDIVMFADLCRAATDSFTMAACGVTPDRRMALQINAEQALYAALDMVWQHKSGLFDDKVAKLSADIIAFASAANGSTDDLPPTNSAVMAVPEPSEIAA